MTKAPRQPKWVNDPVAAAIGQITILQDQVEQLLAVAQASEEKIESQQRKIGLLEEKLAGLTRPRTLLTEKEAAELLRVHLQTMKRWREEKPSPRIVFVQLEGGDVRYRAEDIENYLKSRELRGRAALRAA